MGMASFFCSAKFLLVLVILSAIPVAIIISLESATPTSYYYQFHSTGWFRESSKWDPVNRRFIVSFTDTGGLGVVHVPEDEDNNNNNNNLGVLQEIRVVENTDAVGNGTCGVFIDQPRNRVVVAIADVFGNTYSAVAAYDMDSWKRLFFTQLSSSDGKSFADDVTVDAEGNAYVTDAKGTQIWKVGVDGELLSVIRSPLFHAKEWYKDIVTLNGIVYHPNGYLIVSHTITGNLFKVEIKDDNNKVTVVKVDSSLSIADGMELLSPTKLVVVGANGVKLVESNDDWVTASLIGRSPVLKHRIATAALVKDGKVYINHALGMGYPNKKHVFLQAAFSS